MHSRKKSMGKKQNRILLIKIRLESAPGLEYGKTFLHFQVTVTMAQVLAAMAQLIAACSLWGIFSVKNKRIE